MDFSKYTNFPKTDYLYQEHKHFSTIAIHTGCDPEKVHGSINVPITLSTTFAQKAPTQLYSEFDYGRAGTPTRDAFEKCIAACEYGKYAIAFASGCAAMTGVVHALPKGSHILISDDVYGGTSRYMRQYAIEKFGYQVDFVDLTNIEVVKSNLKQNTSIVWIETPTNPLIKLVDIEELIKKVRQTHPNVWILVDNTFATPYLQSPLLMGADITLNSVSKYIGGHSDIIMGAIVCKDKTIHQKIYHASLSFGGCPSPFDCYLALRGLKTLECRVKNHCKNAFSVAKFLEDHPHVESVIYPGLKSHPQHEIAKKQMRGPGGMISFRIKGGLKEANIFLQSFKLVVLAESLGGVETLVEHPAQMTHASIPEDIRAKLGITDNFIRISIGLEDAVDIMEDFNQALEKACGKI